MEDSTAASWPFRRHITPAGTPPPRIRLVGLHRAFPTGQTSGTRLVLTQATYQLQRWLDWLDATPGVTVLGDYSAASPAQAREAFAQRGPWARIAVDAVPPRPPDAGDDSEPSDPFEPLRTAFERVYAVGDCTHIPNAVGALPKAGVFAAAEGVVQREGDIRALAAAACPRADFSESLPWLASLHRTRAATARSNTAALEPA